MAVVKTCPKALKCQYGFGIVSRKWKHILNKFILIPIALISILSGMIATIAGIGNNLAFVKAQILLSINFGTVFPGQVVTESFTITSQDSSAYALTLYPPSDIGEEDIRPFISVSKDPSETDLDGPISGAPNYTGSGSFTAPDDLSDKWMVTFTAPDTTLPPDVGLDYSCTISIEPMVISPPVPIEDLILRPNADGDYTDFNSSAGGSHWNMVDDIGTDDGNLTYVEDSSDNKFDSYQIEDLNLSPETPIYSITLYAALKGNGSDRTNGFFGLKSGGNFYWGTIQSNLPATYTYYSHTYTTDPATNGLPWTVTAINTLQVGFFVDESNGSGLYATQIYVAVDITP